MLQEAKQSEQSARFVSAGDVSISFVGKLATLRINKAKRLIKRIVRSKCVRIVVVGFVQKVELT